MRAAAPNTLRAAPSPVVSAFGPHGSPGDPAATHSDDMSRNPPRPAQPRRLMPTVGAAVCALVALALVGVLGSALPATSGPAPVGGTTSYGLPLSGVPDVARRF